MRDYDATRRWFREVLGWQFMVEGDLRSGRLTTLPLPGLKQSVRFGAAWLRGRALGGAAEKFVALLNEHDAALRPGPREAQSSP